ncbi:MAG: hypothetical protein WD708_10340 [Kiritimatiellia bacterium]
MVRLHPPPHEVPDNVWHTLLIVLIGSWFVWQTGTECTEIFQTETAVTSIEQALVDGKGHPLYLWLESLTREYEWPALVMNRAFSLAGWFLALAGLIRLLMKGKGLVVAVPPLLVLLTVPGLTPYMSTGGAGGFAVYFFVKALSAVTKTDEKWTWIRAGGYAAVAVGLNPLWFLPALGLLAGVFELYRSRWIRVGCAFAGVGILGALVIGFSSNSGFSGLWPGPAGSVGWPEGWPGLVFHRHFFAVAALTAMIAYGAFRRGIGWWCLVMTLPPILLQSFLASEVMALLVPLWVVGAMGLAKLPMVLNLKYPRSYLSVLLCQLLLWVPAYLDFLL